MFSIGRGGVGLGVVCGDLKRRGLPRISQYQRVVRWFVIESVPAANGQFPVSENIVSESDSWREVPIIPPRESMVELVTPVLSRYDECLLQVSSAGRQSGRGQNREGSKFRK